jgi:nitrate/nitrite-specific signal transduction histidine kinase
MAGFPQERINMSFERNLEVAARLIAALKEDMHSRDEAAYKKETLKDICDAWHELNIAMEKRKELDNEIDDLHDQLDELVGALQIDLKYFPSEECSVF